MKTTIALLAAFVLSLAVIPPRAEAGTSCTSYRVGNYTYTNCY